MENGQFQLLIVDDSSTFMKIAKEMLNRKVENVNIWEATSGMEALRILGNHDIDIILLDVFMPVYDGFEMAKIIRASEKTSKIPIIFITGSDPSKELMTKAVTLGAVDYLTKPFTEMELQRLVTLYLRFVKWEREINKKLDNKNTELINEISERKKVEKSLLDLTKKLEDANATKDKFFSIIAHDLKNPLGAFKNVTEMMVDSFGDFDKDEILEFIELMKDSAGKLYALLENLLLWSRTQQGIISYNPDELNLYLIAKENFDILKHLADAKKIKLNNNIPKEIIVKADSNMINTVFRNLISNAIKFTQIGGNVWTDFQIKENIVEVSVNDNGVGISPDDISKLFQIGVSRTTTGTNMETGTGLGLILCKEFMLKHEGEIWVESKIDKGTKFKFTLKLATNEQQIFL